MRVQYMRVLSAIAFLFSLASLAAASFGHSDFDSLSKRSPGNPIYEDLFDIRDNYLDDILEGRSDLSKYDRLLLARELVSLVLNSDNPFTKRAPTPSTYVNHVRLSGPGGLHPQDYEVSLSKNTFGDARDVIYRYWKGNFALSRIHIWRGDREADYSQKLGKGGVEIGDTLRYTIDNYGNWQSTFGGAGNRAAPPGGPAGGGAKGFSGGKGKAGKAGKAKAGGTGGKKGTKK